MIAVFVSFDEFRTIALIFDHYLWLKWLQSEQQPLGLLVQNWVYLKIAEHCTCWPVETAYQWKYKWKVLKQYGVYYSVTITHFFTVMPC